MKMGQMASYVDTGLGEDLRSALASLQSDAPSMSWQLAQSALEEGLGKPTSKLFRSIEHEPLAAASIGQVHRAVTLDGRKVAVKIQYPEAADAIRADLRNSAMIAKLLSTIFPSMNTSAMAGEISQRIEEELDYTIELSVQTEFHAYYADHPVIHIPKPFPELCCSTVLTTELVEGARFPEALTWSQHERDLIGETIFRFVFRSLYRMQLFNGDPHPGNYIFLGNGRVSFLDFGFSRRFTDSEMEIFIGLVKSMVVDRDPHQFRQYVEKAGLIVNAEGLSDATVSEYFASYYAVVDRPETSAISPEYCRSLFRHSFARDHQLAGYVNVPPSFVVLQRINLGMYSLLASLGSQVNWRRVAEEIWPFAAGAPSTQTGRLEAEWARKKS